MANVTIRRGDKQLGPYPLAQVQQWYKEGRLLPTDMAWEEGAPSWVTLSTFMAGLHPVAAGSAAPPPPPPPPPPSSTTKPPSWASRNKVAAGGLVLVSIPIVLVVIGGIFAGLAGTGPPGWGSTVQPTP